MPALVVILMLLLAAPAGAATVGLGKTQVCEDKSGCASAPKLRFTAAAGEANDLRVTGANRSFTFEDPGAVITAGAGCEADGDHRAVCFVENYVAVVLVELGDGNDRADVPALAIVEGGAGDDVLSGGVALGGEGNDTLSGAVRQEGGPGDDRLIGGGDAGPGDDVVDASGQSGGGARLGPGRDVYLGSPGTDWVYDDGGADPSVDTIDGGGGVDTISYEGTAGPVVVDLGGPGSTDQLTGFEDARGSPAADTLLGTERDDDLRGDGGDDRIEGRGGNDSIEGDFGNDRLDGGSGGDRVRGGPDRDVLLLGEGDDHASDSDDLFRDQVDCGAGEDTASLDRGDDRTGCERPTLLRPHEIVTHVAPAGGGRYRLHYVGWCEEWPSCRGKSRIAVRVGARTVPVKAVRFAGIGGRRLPRSKPFRLPAAAARTLRERGRLTLRVTSWIDPGAAAGVLPAEDRVRLSRDARPTRPDR